jgi:hypothetical protein
LILVADTHVHVYPCHDLEAALRHGARNLARLSAALGGHALRALCLTEGAGQNVFRALAAGEMRPGRITVHATVEPTALRVETDEGALLVIAGRQVATTERLEVLALGTQAALPDGRSLAETVAAVQAARALAVVPWSPGKWLFARGRILDRLLDAPGLSRPLLADSSLRPRGIPEPPQFAQSRAAGFVILAGSDSLPFPGEERLVGRYAVVCHGAFDPQRPATSILALLAASSAAVGTRRTLPAVAWELARLALRRRRA